MQIPKNIFKAYDIRGIYNEELTEESVKKIAESLCKIYHENNETIVVGRDGRLSSLSLSQALIQGFLESGKKVIDIGEVATPLMYFSVNHFKLNSGVIITGSHNPKNYNGLKIIMNGSALAGEEIQEIYKNINTTVHKNINTNNEQLKSISINDEYINSVLKNITLNKKLKIAIDAGNGVAGPIALKVYKKLGLEVIDLYCDIDGNFPNHHPNPSDPNNLCDLISVVKKEKCDLGIAFDGDGDRCLIIDNKGVILWPDRQMMLYSQDILSRHKKSKIVYDVKSSKDLPIYIKENGGIPIMCRTGHSYIKMKMKEVDAMLGGEMSGHIFFKERWFGFDDGVYTGARMLEIISNQDKTSNELFSELPFSYTTPEINIILDKDGFQHEFMEKFVKESRFPNSEISTMDGLRADYKNGWGLIRASNTTPCLVMRFEADTEKELLMIKQKFVEEIYKIDPKIEIPNGKK